MSGRLPATPYLGLLDPEDSANLTNWLKIVGDPPSEHCAQRQFLAKFLFRYPRIYADKTLIIMGCGCGQLCEALRAPGMKGSRAPRAISAFDVAGDDCRCATPPTSASDQLLRPGKQDCPFSPDLSESRESGGPVDEFKKADLIIFCHPFFFAECERRENKRPPPHNIEAVRVAREKTLRVFLAAAQRHLRDPAEGENDKAHLADHPSVIMPYFDDGADHPDSDPGIQGPENDYWTFAFDGFLADNPRAVHSAETGQSEDGHKIYRLLPRFASRCELRSPCSLRRGVPYGHTPNVDLAYEMTPWVRCLGKAENPHSTFAKAFLQFVAAPLTGLCLDSACGEAGALVVYYNHAATDKVPRIGSRVLGARRGQDAGEADWLHAFNDVFARKRPDEIGEFDLTETILSDFRNRAKQVAARDERWKQIPDDCTSDPPDFTDEDLPAELKPFFLICGAHRRKADAVDGSSDCAPNRLYSGAVTVRFSTAPGTQPQDAIPAPECSNRLLSLVDGNETRRTGLAGYLKWYLMFFQQNCLLNAQGKGIPDLNFVLLPLWIGTLRDPIPLGSVILFTSGRPSRDFLNGVICTATQYLEPIRTLQLVEHVKEEIGSKVALETQRELGKAWAHSLGNALNCTEFLAEEAQRLIDEECRESRTSPKRLSVATDLIIRAKLFSSQAYTNNQAIIRSENPNVRYERVSTGRFALSDDFTNALLTVSYRVLRAAYLGRTEFRDPLLPIFGLDGSVLMQLDTAYNDAVDAEHDQPGNAEVVRRLDELTRMKDASKQAEITMAGWSNWTTTFMRNCKVSIDTFTVSDKTFIELKNWLTGGSRMEHEGKALFDVFDVSISPTFRTNSEDMHRLAYVLFCELLSNLFKYCVADRESRRIFRLDIRELPKEDGHAVTSFMAENSAAEVSSVERKQTDGGHAGVVAIKRLIPMVLGYTEKHRGECTVKCFGFDASLRTFRICYEGR